MTLIELLKIMHADLISADRWSKPLVFRLLIRKSMVKNTDYFRRW